MDIDPASHPVYNRLYGAITAYAALANVIEEVLTFNLDEIYEPESPEYLAAADVLNGLLYLTNIYQGQTLEEMQKILKQES